MDGVTKLTANVNYQASALLGNSPQNEIVKAKIEAVLNDMRAELKAPKPWSPRLDLESSQTPDELHVRTQPSTGTKNIFSARQDNLFEKLSFETPASPLSLSPEPHSDISAPINTQPDAQLAASATALEPEVITKKNSSGHKGSAVKKAPAERTKSSSGQHRAAITNSTAGEIASRKTIEPPPPVRAASGQIVAAVVDTKDSKIFKGKDRRTGPQTPIGKGDAKRVERRRIAPMIEVPLRGLLRINGSAIGGSVLPRKLWKIVLAAAAFVLLLAGLTAYMLRDQLSFPTSWKAAVMVWPKEFAHALPSLSAKEQIVEAESIPFAPLSAAPTVPSTATMSESVGEPASDTPSDTVGSTAPDTSSPILHDPAAMVKPEHNIYQWVQDWSVAMQSRDPSAQASYYAHAVNQYLTHTKVSRGFVLKDKDSAGWEAGSGLECFSRPCLCAEAERGRCDLACDEAYSCHVSSG